MPALQPGGTDSRPGILSPSARNTGGLTRNEAGGGNAGLMGRTENDRTVFRAFHKTLKIDATDFHIPTATTTNQLNNFSTEKPEKTAQTTGASSLILLD